MGRLTAFQDRRAAADWVFMRPVIQLYVGVNPALYYLQTIATAGMMLTLYLMRRRVRLGRRIPTF